VTVTSVLEVLRQNAATAQEVVARVVADLPEARSCACGRALEHAIITQPDAVSPDTLERLRPLVGRYFATTRTR
jgi:5'-methylthioadenosine phosphorylase